MNLPEMHSEGLEVEYEYRLYCIRCLSIQILDSVNHGDYYRTRYRVSDFNRFTQMGNQPIVKPSNLELQGV